MHTVRNNSTIQNYNYYSTFFTTIGSEKGGGPPCTPDQVWGSGWPQGEWSSRRFFHPVMSRGWTCRGATDCGGWNSEPTQSIRKIHIKGTFSSLQCKWITTLKFVALKHLPSWLGHLSEVREVFLDPRVDVLQSHLPVRPAVDGKLDHGHVGVRRPLWYGLLDRSCSHLYVLSLWRKHRERLTLCHAYI